MVTSCDEDLFHSSKMLFSLCKDDRDAGAAVDVCSCSSKNMIYFYLQESSAAGK